MARSTSTRRTGRDLRARGRVVTRAYVDDERANESSKIPDGPTGAWHRTGDVGWIDADDRVWIVGRKTHRIEQASGIAYPVPTENVCDLHPRVRRSALVGIGPRGAQRAVLVIEPAGDLVRSAAEKARIAEEIGAWRRDRQRAIGPNEPVDISATLFCADFPVDVRHNAKIRREDLAAWATRVLGQRTSA